MKKILKTIFVTIIVIWLIYGSYAIYRLHEYEKENAQLNKKDFGASTITIGSGSFISSADHNNEIAESYQSGKNVNSAFRCNVSLGFRSTDSGGGSYWSTCSATITYYNSPKSTTISGISGHCDATNANSNTTNGSANINFDSNTLDFTCTVNFSCRTTDSGGGSYWDNYSALITYTNSNKTAAVTNISGHCDATNASNNITNGSASVTFLQ